MNLNRWYRKLTFDRGEERQLETQRDLEGGPNGGGEGQTIMGILNPEQLITPDGLVGGCYAP